MHEILQEVSYAYESHSEGVEFSFNSDVELDNIESMREWLESNELSDYVAEDEGTLVYLTDSDSGLSFSVESYGLGDFYSHAIAVNVFIDESQE